MSARRIKQVSLLAVKTTEAGARVLRPQNIYVGFKTCVIVLYNEIFCGL